MFTTNRTVQKEFQNDVFQEEIGSDSKGLKGNVSKESERNEDNST